LFELQIEKVTKEIGEKIERETLLFYIHQHLKLSKIYPPRRTFILCIKDQDTFKFAIENIRRFVIENIRKLSNASRTKILLQICYGEH